MKIKMLGNADGNVAGVMQALFDGQTYEVIDANAQQLIALGRAVAVEDAVSKAVHGPPEDKALKAPVRRTRK